MDLCKDESPVAAELQKSFSIETKPRPVLVSSGKNNAEPTSGKPRTREFVSRYKSATPRSRSPNAKQTSTFSRTPTPQRAQSAERRRPSTPSSPSARRSAPSSPSSRSPPSTPSSKSSVPSSPSARPSTPLSPSSRSTTPVCDTMVERLNSSRRSLVGRTPDGLWPSMRSLSSSFQSESSIPASKSLRPVRDPSPVSSSKSSLDVPSETKRTPLRGRNTSDQTENSRPVENSHARAIEQLRWPGMIGGKVSSNALSSKCVDFTDKTSRSASLALSMRGPSPTRRTSLSDAVNRVPKNSTKEAARPASPRGIEKSALIAPVRGPSPTRGTSLTDALSRSLKAATTEATEPVSFKGSDKAAPLVTPPVGLSPRKRMSSSDDGSRSANEVPRPGSSKGRDKAAPLVSPAPELSPTKETSLSDDVSRGLKNFENEVARPGSSKGRDKAVNIPSLAAKLAPLSFERIPSRPRPSRSPSPVPTLVRPPSPSKVSAALCSTSRGMLNPSRTRPSSPRSSSSNAWTRAGASTSFLNYVVDVQKGKRSPTYTEDAHLLRLLHNRNLQWRFVNASADATVSSQKLIAEDMLYSMCNFTSELRDSVAVKRIGVENLRQEMKLKLLLEEQIAYLQHWSALEAEHSTALSVTTGALKASTLRLPVTGKARADVRAAKNAISSAVDVMQAMGSSICYLLPRVEGANSLVSELYGVAATESIMLDECRELLASIGAMQVQECSLRTHLMQLRQDVQID